MMQTQHLATTKDKHVENLPSGIIKSTSKFEKIKSSEQTRISQCDDISSEGSRSKANNILHD